MRAKRDEERERSELADAMAAELLTLANLFDSYAAGHRAKGTEEGHDKARRNQAHADRIRGLLVRARAAGVGA